MKTVNELIDYENSTWNIIQGWVNKTNSINIFPRTVDNAEKDLYQLQVTTKSVLGAIVYHTGGILINNGWLRILGSGSSAIRSIVDWNQIDPTGINNKYKGVLLVADDVIGGFFALNAGVLDGKQGNVFYLAPDTLEWEDLGLTYSQFIQWTFSENINKFYESFRWENWPEEINDIDGYHGMLIYPFLWTDGPSFKQRSKKTVPINELWELTIDNMQKLGNE